MAPAAARFHGDPTARAARRRRSRAPTARPPPRSSSARCSRRPGAAAACSGPSTSVVGGEERADRAHDARGDRPPAHVPRDARRRRPACAMEISSHALELRRADGIHVAAAVFTNLTQDHLDFHPHDGGLLPGQAAAVRLAADRRAGGRTPTIRTAARLADEFPDTLTFGIERRADYRAVDVRDRLRGHRLHVRDAGRRRSRCTSRCRAASTCPTRSARGRRARGARRADVIGRRAAARRRVPGRFEPVDEGQPFAVLVDYAHTPDSLENVLRAARELADGARDRRVRRGRRPRSRQAAADGGDRRAAGRRRLVTSDNPRSEDPEAIIAEILAGAGAAERRARRRPPRGRSTARSALARAGRRRGHRRQGPRAGPGVRRRAQGAVRRRRGRARGAARRDGTGTRRWLADARPAPRLVARRRRRPGARRDRLARGGPGRSVRGPGRRAAPTAAASPRGALEAGAWGVLVGPPGRDLPGGAVLVADDPLARSARSAGPGGASSAPR